MINKLLHTGINRTWFVTIFLSVVIPYAAFMYSTDGNSLELYLLFISILSIAIFLRVKHITQNTVISLYSSLVLPLLTFVLAGAMFACDSFDNQTLPVCKIMNVINGDYLVNFYLVVLLLSILFLSTKSGFQISSPKR